MATRRGYGRTAEPLPYPPPPKKHDCCLLRQWARKVLTWYAMGPLKDPGACAALFALLRDKDFLGVTERGAMYQQWLDNLAPPVQSHSAVVVFDQDPMTGANIPMTDNRLVLLTAARHPLKLATILAHLIAKYHRPAPVTRYRTTVRRGLSDASMY